MTDEISVKRRSPSADPRPQANKRTRSSSSTRAPEVGGSGGDGVLEAFGSFRDEIDEHNDRRERLIKTSRDVTALSKKLIFLLHRFDIRDFGASDPSPPTRSLFDEAQAKLDHIVDLLRQAAQTEGLDSAEVGMQRSFRYERNIGGGLEEFIEALSFYHYLRTTQLISLSQTQARFNTIPRSESSFYPPTSAHNEKVESVEKVEKVVLRIPIHRYLLGLSDLTGELMRFATNAVGKGDTGKIVNHVLVLTRNLATNLDPFIPLVSDLRKKQHVTLQSLRKIEDILYAITVRSAEFASNPEALQEMLRRSLNPSAQAPTDND